MDILRLLAVFLVATLVAAVSQASRIHNNYPRSLANRRLRKRLTLKTVQDRKRSDNVPRVKRFLPSGAFNNLKIASFNVQIFGKNKMSHPDVVNTLVKIILRYDIVLIMEIRDITETAIDDLLNQVNGATSATSRRSRKTKVNNVYDKIVSPRLGRTASKEQYAFFYRTNMVSVVRSYVYDDGDESKYQDTFEREPFVVQFHSTSTKLTDFVLVGIHTSPLSAPAEIDALVDVYDDIISKWSMNDVIILGDLNAACSYMSDSDWKTNRLFNDKRFTWLIDDCIDTTVGGSTCAYDRFVSAGSAMKAAVVPETARRFKFDSEYNITNYLALKVSDHYPIEINLLSKEFSDALQSVRESVEYKFYSNSPPRLTYNSIYRIAYSSNPLLSLGFVSETSKSSSGAIAVITNSKKVISDQGASQALSLIYLHWKNLLKIDQVDLALYKVVNKKFHKNSLTSAVVKLVCRKIPTPVECWVALEM